MRSRPRREDAAFVAPAPARRHSSSGRARAFGPSLHRGPRQRRLLREGGASLAPRRCYSGDDIVRRGAVLLQGVAQVYAAILLGVYLLQRKLIFIPPPQAEDPRRQGGDPEVITLPTAGGKGQLAAAFFRPVEKDGPVLVYFHGNADQIGWGGAYLGNYYKNKHGLGLYAIEYPGYGLARPGTPKEESIYAAAEAMLAHLEESLGVPRSRTVLFGQSVGCAVAVEMAKRRLGCRLVLLAPFTSTAGIARAVYPLLAPAVRLFPFLVRDRFDNKAKAKSLDVPSLVIHGEEDEIVPKEMGEELASLIPDARLQLVPGMGHNDVFEREEVLMAIAAFARGQ